jgi:hypothetical protein
MAQNLLDLIKKHQQKAQAGNRQKTIKPQNGRNRYRILPGWNLTADELKAWIKSAPGTPLIAEDPTFFVDFGQHWIKDSSNKIVAVTVCQEKTFGKPCDVCAAISHGIINSVDDLTKTRLEDAQSSARVLLNVLELDGPNPHEPQILEIAPSVFNGRRGTGGIIGLFSEYPDLLHPTRGTDIIVTKAGSGREGTTYDVMPAGSSKPITDLSILKRVANLNTYVQDENDEANRKALMQVSAIAGVLPAPTKPVEFDDVPDFMDDAPKAAPAKAVARPAKEEVEDVVTIDTANPSDADLEALLKGLD